MKRFQNWSGAVRFRPADVAIPESEGELQALILEHAKTNRKLRVVGSGHSFSPLVETNDTLISLDRLQGVSHVDSETGSAEVLGGTKLWKMNELLFQAGRALENLGDIDRQSIAGTVSTGTHGTGAALGSVSTQIEELSLITASGERLRVSEKADRDLFKAAQVSLGSLGVITRLKLRTLPAYKLKLVQKRESLRECLEVLDAKKSENRHFEFFYFPYTDRVQSKYVNVTEEPVREKGMTNFLNELVLENGAFKLLSECSRWIPGTTRAVARICGAAVSETVKTHWSHRVFATPRLVRFQEMEFSVPATAMKDVVTELSQMIEKNRMRVHFPIECRFVKGDDIWLSPAYGRDSAYVAIHSYRGMEHRPYFEAAQSIFRNHGGRPHWGKMHSLTAKELHPLYPKWEAFQEIRRRLDPSGRFLNDSLKTMFEGEK